MLYFWGIKSKEMSFNKVMLIGNVGKDPEVKHLESGTTVASFTLATTEKYKDRNGVLQDQTEWHNIVCWRNLAELSEKYITKGSQIFVEGKIRTRSWTDQAGIKKYTTEIIADNIRLLDRRSNAQNVVNEVKPITNITQANNSIINNEEEDDLPF